MKSIKLLMLTLVLFQTSAFAYTMVDVDPVQRAVDFCDKWLKGKYPDAVTDPENATVRIWMQPSEPSRKEIESFLSQAKGRS